MNFSRLAADWLRFLRGKRSQRAFSKRLGYRSNIAYRWESEVCFPTAAEVLKIVERTGVPLTQRVESFFGTAAPAGLPAQLATGAGVAALLRVLRGNTHLVELSRRSGFSRFSIARWLKGAAEPRLPEFLAVVEAASFRCLDFLSLLVELDRLPSAAATWQTLQAARKAAYDVPWSHAVLRALELTDYAGLESPRPGWLAHRLGISRAQEERCLKTLAAAHQIRKEGARWLVDHSQTIDTRGDPERSRKLKAEWFKVALDRLRDAVPGAFSYNLMAVSRKDLARLRELHLSYFREMQSLVADSDPSECVVLFNTALFALDAHALPRA
jgi:hypothetical protein